MNSEMEKMTYIELRIAYGEAWTDGRYRDAVKFLLAMAEREIERKSGGSNEPSSAVTEN